MTTTTHTFTPGDAVRVLVDHNDDERGWIIGTFIAYVEFDKEQATAANWCHWYDDKEVYRMAIVKLDDYSTGSDFRLDTHVGVINVDTIVEDCENITPVKWHVRAYEVSREYGGAEEGGWWYDAGEAVTECFEVNSEEEARSLRERLESEYPTTDRRYSVLGGEDYSVDISLMPLPDRFPEFRPHYE